MPQGRTVAGQGCDGCWAGLHNPFDNAIWPCAMRASSSMPGADLGRAASPGLSHNPKSGRASVRASPNICGNPRKSGLARPLAFPNGRFRDDLCRGGQTRVGMPRASRIMASNASGTLPLGLRWPGSKSDVTNARQRLAARLSNGPGEFRGRLRVGNDLLQAQGFALRPFQDQWRFIVARRSGME